ncbi:glycoside hydrolase family 38 C-terminal domain-containing protein [Candidatus Clostridium radicumherbarum]|uniref:Glycoside hydrolase family 38 C-terminal domain-containing protein n=1 Tax=Candidatus Clostridium radicumherbarum TaxID=3381662 RepID=A0ABW8TSP8_9CLOT
MKKGIKKLMGAGMAASMLLTTLPAGTVQAYDKTSTVNMIGNAHIDAAWNWRYAETISTVIPDTFKRALDLMDANPDYRFSQSSSQLYQWAKEYYPDLAARIDAKVKNGQWEIVGGQVIEPDLNNTNGESLVRQSLLAQNYFRDNYGILPNIGWVPDVFGFNYNMPQILKKSGMDYFVTTKLNWQDTNKWPYEYFNWTAPDGSTVTSYKPTNDYSLSGGSISGSNLANTLNYTSSLGLNSSLVLYGSGDHGGGPTQSDINNIRNINTNSSYPTIKMSTTAETLKSLDQQVKDKNTVMPNVDNELYFEYHRGVMTTADPMKKYNRYSEETAEQAEKFSSVASILGSAAYPQQKINAAWQKTLLNQFHDVLPGSAIAPVYADAFNDAEIALNELNSVKNTAINGIANRINTQGDGQPILLYNALSWDRTDAVQADVNLSSPDSSITILDVNGNEIPNQVINKSGNKAVIAFEASIPALGYSIYRAVEKKSADFSSTIKVDAANKTFENQFFKVSIDPVTGNIASIFDKKNNKEVVDAGQQFNRLQFLADTPREYESWNIDYDDMSATPTEVNAVTAPVTLVENGPTKATFKVSKVSPSGLSTIDEYITLYNTTNRIDLDLKVNWNEKQTMLKVAFPMSVHPQNVTYDIAYSTISRPAANTKGMFEVEGYKFADMSKDGFGVAVLSDSKEGWDCPNGVLRLSLLRSPIDNRGGATDIGNREIKYSFYPHSGDWKTADVEAKSYEYNYPISSFAVTNHSGDLAASASFAKAASDDNNAVLSVFKKAETRQIDQKNNEDRSNSYIVRLVETEGKDNTKVNVTLPAAISGAKEVNLIEDTIAGAAAPEVSGKSFSTTLNKYEIKTFLVKFNAVDMFKDQKPQTQPVDLATYYNLDGMSFDSNRKDGNLNGNGETYSADLMPDKVTSEDVTFNVGPKADGNKNIVQATGQTIETANAGKHQYLFMLGNSTAGVGIGEFKVNYTDGTSSTRTFSFAGWQDTVGYAQKTYIKDTIGLNLSHTHTPNGNTFDIDNNLYVYKMVLDSSKTIKNITLPDSKAIKIAAMSFVDGNVVISADQQAPSKVNNLKAAGTKQYYNPSINLTWDAASDNVGVVNYFIYRATKEDLSDAKLLANTADTKYTDSDFASVNKYYYAVCAQDEAGNIGPLSNINSVYAGANIALFRPTTADGQMNASEAASLINDGNISTKWCYNDGTTKVHWNTIDLGTDKTIDGFKIYHAAAGGETTDWNTSAYKILVSSDNTNWTTAVTRTGNKDNITEDILSTPVTGRYVRFEATKPTNTSDVAARIYELQVYGDDKDFPQAVPEAPQITSIVQNDTSAVLNLNFAKDTDNITVKYGTKSGVYDNVITGVMANTVTVNNLSIGKTYYFTVIPYNILGEGKASQETSFKVFQNKSTSVDLSSYFNLDGASTPDKPAEGMFDTVGWAYDAAVMPSVINYANIKFMLGSMADTDKNIVSCVGQTITLPTATAANRIYLIESGAGTQSGVSIKVNYSDGTNTTKSLNFTDWCQSPSSSEKVVYSMDHRIYTKSGITGPATNLFIQPIVVDSSKQITSITLPNKSGAKIFAVSLVNLVDPDTLSHNTSLSTIKIGDTPLANFDKSTLEYNVPLPASTTAAPKVTVTTDDPNAYAVVTQASKFPGTATITVTADDGLTVGTYKVNFKVKLGSAAITVDNTTLERNNTAKAAVTAKLDNDTDTDITKTTVEYLTSDPMVAAIDKNTGAITAANVGTAEVYAKVTLDGVTVESNKITITVDTSAASIEKLIAGFTKSNDLVGPLVPQLSNNLTQAKNFISERKADQAVIHMGDFIKHLNNPPMDSRISASAKEILNLDAQALIDKWSK